MSVMVIKRTTQLESKKQNK